LGESFINQAIATAIKAGLLAEAFGDGEISLAEGGVLLRIEREGDVYHGYIHLTYKLSGMIRRIVGRSSLTFPVHLGLKLRIEEKEGLPNLVIQVAEASASTEMLLKGALDVGMFSDVNKVPRLRGIVIKKIQDSVKEFQGQTLVELPLPFLKGTFFERTQFKSDGFGRANALFKVDQKRLIR
jgi:hypothetical protein